MTDDLRDAMRAAASREPSNAQAWANFTATKRRATIARTVLALVGALAAFIALILLLPGVKAGQGSAPIGAGPSESPVPPSPSKHYVDAVGHLQANFPSEWFGRGIGGMSADFYPKTGDLNEASDLMKVNGGGAEPVRAAANGFFVRIHLRTNGERSELSNPLDVQRRANGGATVTRGALFKAPPGRTYIDQLRVIYPAAPVEPAGGWQDGAPRYWCGGCIVEEVAIPRASDIVEVLIVSPDQDAYDRYHPLALGVLASIADYIAPSPSSAPSRL